jgi:ATP/ADP translocase
MNVNELPSSSSRSLVLRKLLQWVNLRPEEAARTFWMFMFYTSTSVGMLWFEVGTAALFIGEYGADSLPWIYIASAGIGTGLGFLYSWMQKFLPLRSVIVLIALLMALPLPLFWLGLGTAWMFTYAVFLMRLWVEALYVLSELNTSITANQLFNIREIKRTFPLVSSGILMADVLSGFSLPFFRGLIGLQNLVLLAAAMMVLAAGILLYISRAYSQCFPDLSRRRSLEAQTDYSKKRHLQGPIRNYVILVVTFFVMLQVLLLLIDFEYLSQLEQNLTQNFNVAVEDLADFLAVFSGVLGMFELLMQWFVSSRLVERLGVFVVAMLPPALTGIIALGALTVLRQPLLFWMIILLKFVDELMRYTLVASTSPVLFQPIPDRTRGEVQSIVRGMAEPISIGLTGVGMLLLLSGVRWFFPALSFVDFFTIQNGLFLAIIAIASGVWFWTVWRLRSQYLGLLVLSAERGQLEAFSDIDLHAFQRSLVEMLKKPGQDEDKQSCIEMLTHLNPKGVGEVLVPLLPDLSPPLQRQSFEALMQAPNPAYLESVRSLIVSGSLPPEVLALALRYVWLADSVPNPNELRTYLTAEVDPMVRGTAASLMLRFGNPQERAEGAVTVRRMLKSTQERERFMGARALGEAIHLESLRLFLESLLRDESLRVRCAMLEAIAATRQSDFYPALVRALHYKSTRGAAIKALVRLENEAVPLMLAIAEDIHKPDSVRSAAWSVLGQIETPEATDALVTRLMTAWGNTRRNILRLLLKLSKEEGIEAVTNTIGRSGIEMFIDQELMFMGHTYAAIIDFQKAQLDGRPVELLVRALQDTDADVKERLFLLMRFLYPADTIQAAAFNLQSASSASIAQGLEILDNTIDIPSKAILLNVFERQSNWERLRSLHDIYQYVPMEPGDRLRALLELRHFLSDWALACCFQLAYHQRWRINPDHVLAGIRHPTGFVREVAVIYVHAASPRTFRDLYPALRQDPSPIVSALAEKLMEDLVSRQASRHSISSSDKGVSPPKPKFV